MKRLSKLFISVKPGDTILLGHAIITVIEVTSDKRLKLQFEAPTDSLIEFQPAPKVGK